MRLFYYLLIKYDIFHILYWKNSNFFLNALTFALSFSILKLLLFLLKLSLLLAHPVYMWKFRFFMPRPGIFMCACVTSTICNYFDGFFFNHWPFLRRTSRKTRHCSGYKEIKYTVSVTLKATYLVLWSYSIDLFSKFLHSKPGNYIYERNLPNNVTCSD